MNHNSEELYSDFDIAVVGMACRFPGAKTAEEFWTIISEGKESISFFSQEELKNKGVPQELLNDSSYVPAGAVIEDADLFDAQFFGLLPIEAEILDPQQRLFLECCWNAWEDAGYHSDYYSGLVGVFGGTTMNTYLVSNVIPNKYAMDVVGNLQTMIGNDKDFITTRVSHQLNLTGPSFAIQTACSTSLAAIHIACQNLLSGECDMALAGGSSLRFPQGNGYQYQKGGTSSPDGHCRAFDAKAAGSVVGNGAGIVVLKRLKEAIADQDQIYGVIKGSATNNDGSNKAGFSTPSVDGQSRAVAQALAVANVDPNTIGYVEAHGTGTNIGDPIEVTGLTQAFRGFTKEKQYCALGSVKANIGHLDAAAGISGFIKTLLCLNHKKLPPLVNFEKPNPQIDFENSPFYVNTKLCEWKPIDGVRRAGVTAIGLGGANVHVVVQEPPAMTPSKLDRETQIILLSAKTETALKTKAAQLAERLKQQPDVNLADVAHTLQVGRKKFNYRLALSCQNVQEAVTMLENVTDDQILKTSCADRSNSIAFMFPGQGTQYPGMAYELYQKEPQFKKHLDDCFVLLQKFLDTDFKKVLFAEPSENAEKTLKDTALAQPALFIVEYALAKFWMHWGIEPVLMMGHSIGEYVAATISGVFSLEDALRVVVERGRLMQRLPRGKMLSVVLSEEQAKQYLGNDISLAAVNSAQQCVFSGTTTKINQLEKQLLKEGVRCRALETSHAFHSSMMDSIIEPFTELLKTISLHAPKLDFVSNVTGNRIKVDEATNPSYWATHLRETVRFADGINNMIQQNITLLLEVGPGNVLTNLALQASLDPGTPVACGAKRVKTEVISSLLHPKQSSEEIASLVEAIGKLWLYGAKPKWSQFHLEKRSRISLPTYPFEKKRYWLDPMPSEPKVAPQQSQEGTQIIIKAEEIVKAFQLMTGLGANTEIRIPLTSAQKRAEPCHIPTALPSEVKTPQGLPVQDQVAEIWKELLGISHVTPHSNLMELGAHSLMMTQLLSRLHQAFQVDLSIQELFDHPTLSSMTQLIEQRKGVKSAPTPDAFQVKMTAPKGSSIQDQVAEIWKELLGINEITPHSNLMELGAHSLMMTQLLSRLHKAFKVDLSIQDLFDNPTLSAMTRLIEQRSGVSPVKEDNVDEILQALEGLSQQEIDKLLNI